MTGRLGTVETDLSHTGSELNLENGALRITVPGSGRRAQALLGTILSKIRNMSRGVSQGFTYKMRVVSSHFPITVKVQGKQVLIENFIGERFKRYADIIGDTKVDVREDEIIVTGIDKEAVGQTVANIEGACRIRSRDLRKFPDGIYVYQKTVGP